VLLVVLAATLLDLAATSFVFFFRRDKLWMPAAG
jgi:hypothetical protein